MDLTEELGSARDHEDRNEEEILEIEEQIDNILEDICNTEKAKMKTFRMLYDEKPTKQMLSLEKKLCGYTSIGKINKPNPNYIPPEKGGVDDPITNPKKFLLTDPQEVRKFMRDEMQKIYKRQEGVTPERDQILSFLKGNNDEKVI